MRRNNTIEDDFKARKSHLLVCKWWNIKEFVNPPTALKLNFSLHCTYIRHCPSRLLFMDLHQTDYCEHTYRNTVWKGKSKQTTVADSSFYCNNVVIREVAFSSVWSSKVTWQRSTLLWQPLLLFFSMFLCWFVASQSWLTGGEYFISDWELFWAYLPI